MTRLLRSKERCAAAIAAAGTRPGLLEGSFQLACPEASRDEGKDLIAVSWQGGGFVVSILDSPAVSCGGKYPPEPRFVRMLRESQRRRAETVGVAQKCCPEGSNH